MINYVIFTDGGCSGNPGTGAWAFNIYSKDKHVYGESAGSRNTTNNIMELTAVIRGLTYYKNKLINSDDKDVILFTDSEYVQKGITDWISAWKNNNWVKSDGKPVKNVDLWQSLDALNSELNISWYHVKGHSGVEGNEKCDLMVQNVIKKLNFESHNYESNTLF